MVKAVRMINVLNREGRRSSTRRSTYCWVIKRGWGIDQGVKVENDSKRVGVDNGSNATYTDFAQEKVYRWMMLMGCHRKRSRRWSFEGYRYATKSESCDTSSSRALREVTERRGPAGLALKALCLDVDVA